MALESARVGMHAEVKRLVADRAEAAAWNEERMSSRLVDVLSKELVQEFVQGAGEGRSRPHQEPAPAAAPGPTRLAAAGAGVLPDPGPEAAVQAKVSAALELVDRIATFVRSGRPALELSLNGAIDVQVQVERTGRNQVALLVRGRSGPPAPEDLSRIRDALAERGLKLSSLSVG